MSRNRILLLLVGVALLLFSGCEKNAGEAKKKSESKFVEVTIPSGTMLSIAIADTIQTNQNHTGDNFSGSLTQPTVLEGKKLLPAGSKISLVITKLVKGGTLKTKPEIAFTVIDIAAPNGKSYSVEADTFYQKGRSHTAREVGMIGGGAAAGAVIGGAVGKGKGAVIGAVTGAAAGTGVAAATGRQNLIFPAGLVFNFTLKKPLTISVPKKEMEQKIFDKSEKTTGK